MNWIAGEVGSVAAEEGGLGVEGAAGEDPPGMGPPGAFVRGVGVALVVRVLMMNAMCGDPEDRSAFESHGSAGCEEVLDPLGCFVAAVREQAMVSHADAYVDREEVHDSCDGDVGPREEEERGDGSYMEDAHRDGGDPVDAAFLISATHAKVFTDSFSGSFGGRNRRLRRYFGLRRHDFFGGDQGGAHRCSMCPLVVLIKRYQGREEVVVRLL